MGRTIDLFVTYRFLKLLTTPFNKTEAYKLGIIDKNGHRILKKNSTAPEVEYSYYNKKIYNFTQISLQYQKTIQQSTRS